jgi:hypothetical protein
MAKMNGGFSAFSSGPAITEAIPVAQRTPVIPTQYGIPVMDEGHMRLNDSFSGTDGRVSEIPAMGMNDRTVAEAPRYNFNEGSRKGMAHPDHKENFEKHRTAIQEATAEKRPMSVQGHVGKSKTYREENLPKAHDEVPDDADMSMAESDD